MNAKYEPLFKELKLPNGVVLRNRFVLAPLTHVSSNDDGSISDIAPDAADEENGNTDTVSLGIIRGAES